MMISMPIWMLILFLAVAMVAGLAAALLWVNVTDLRKIKQDLRILNLFARSARTDAQIALNQLNALWEKKEPEREDTHQ